MARFATQMLFYTVLGVCLCGAAGLSAARNYPQDSQRNPQQVALNESPYTISGTIKKFKEHEDLIIQDDQGDVEVEMPKKYEQLGLSVGEKITARGALIRNADGSRTLIAENIKANGNGTTEAPAPIPAVEPKAAKVSDVKTNGVMGSDVWIEGVLLDMPSDQMLLIQDASGNIMVDITGLKNLTSKMGDKVSVKGQLNAGKDNQKMIKATSVEAKK